MQEIFKIHNTIYVLLFLQDLCLDIHYDRACLIKDFCSGVSLDGNLMENLITKSPLIWGSLCDTIPSSLILFVCPGLQCIYIFNIRMLSGHSKNLN